MAVKAVKASVAVPVMVGVVSVVGSGDISVIEIVGAVISTVNVSVPMLSISMPTVLGALLLQVNFSFDKLFVHLVDNTLHSLGQYLTFQILRWDN